jgi:hypothetical protein
MTSIKDKPAAAAIKDLLSQSPDALREIVRAVMQEMLEAEMTDALQTTKGERTSARGMGTAAVEAEHMSASDPRAAPNPKILLALPGASTHALNWGQRKVRRETGKE